MSATFAGSAAVVGSGGLDDRYRFSLVATLATAVLALGILAFERIAYSDVVRNEYLAMIGLYRGYLLAREPELRPYSVLPAYAPGTPRPKWKVQSALNNLAISVAFINSLAAAAAGALLMQVIHPGSTLKSAVAAGFLLIVFSIGQAAWLKRLYRRGEQDIDHLGSSNWHPYGQTDEPRSTAYPWSYKTTGVG
ncbi:hypothetical protein [Micromonospora sp. NBC_01813]|uniref:hypothetical protein n=1 Tax=Micromonospora sp. NBC_01813 TaxID=2975988 RepID=UPI002DDC889D|nr:hypothetical protein [Micromonospora sp. NBC_01813]WSA06307.1 hypothetical protein OG958_18460 [Micromonospora sp. NBC_01813]